MSIPFTQFMRPNGRKVAVTIDMSAETEALAQRFIEAGGWFECEHLITGHASLTACWNTDEGPDDIAIRIVDNGPLVIRAVEELVKEAAAYAVKRSS